MRKRRSHQREPRKPKFSSNILRRLAGRQQENRVERLLKNSRGPDGKRLFIHVVHHAPNSEMDRQGYDFSVTVRKGEEEISKNFDITINRTAYAEKLKKRPNVIHLYLPITLSDKGIVRRILELFA